MSRHVFPGKAGASSVVLGWDRPLETFFVQVFRIEAGGEDVACVWKGTAPGELPTAASALAIARPHVDLPADLAKVLETDRMKTLGSADGEQQRRAKLRLFRS